ncbi:hypothetical protein IRP63_13875 (plasmid) [Clostridium botulinum]|uniref:Uncharacterized protein n=1 Tax=Clostridium botulinum C/D str. DC5 TaxID=1443128 RepID=A0A0A0HYI4_CLOBO|nr:hypothetical protein [Clostridium botulinum]KGM93587.1 hypothetical protein Z955_14670 [Clostridium botulinum C/D str. DC5]KOC56912.1 hypothetical protein ADU89_01590 [Clostridium botulinum]KOC57387.1 hypothetical protein ADU90_06130 [Clostridium botulinum]MCD3232623.1 hypothetical protein [Clostridium botulinum D/C]MCD3238448.1 hypothetical protein [Clostridium botulinum D/C]
MDIKNLRKIQNSYVVKLDNLNKEYCNLAKELSNGIDSPEVVANIGQSYNKYSVKMAKLNGAIEAIERIIEFEELNS